ncbi:hypothetical protein [Sinorhizobium mexicanum]|uniref:Uncharacterized protein n=1 Tax=Sinorhizobium mexicanum TaxID=375549 RepID=A0A859QRE0_9HYPH|nr:hypothetical protein [Sinorhizobium mexicanum]MBP1886742.1 hypothetical protein [Sinorhizobium mexicanum]QLL65955.1 hypothetical protein FKV68_32330 [Sinorhizobium mexicanum]
MAFLTIGMTVNTDGYRAGPAIKAASTCDARCNERRLPRLAAVVAAIESQHLLAWRYSPAGAISRDVRNF